MKSEVRSQKSDRSGKAVTVGSQMTERKSALQFSFSRGLRVSPENNYVIFRMGI